MKEGVIRDIERQKLKREEEQRTLKKQNLHPDTSTQTNQSHIKAQ
jgi:hypothetical protein